MFQYARVPGVDVPKPATSGVGPRGSVACPRRRVYIVCIRPSGSTRQAGLLSRGKLSSKYGRAFPAPSMRAGLALNKRLVMTAVTDNLGCEISDLVPNHQGHRSSGFLVTDPTIAV